MALGADLNYNNHGLEHLKQHYPGNMSSHLPPLERVGNVEIERSLQFLLVARELSQIHSRLCSQQCAPVSFEGTLSFLPLLSILLAASSTLRRDFTFVSFLLLLKCALTAAATKRDLQRERKSQIK